jgi:Domain of unknown function (DUF1877)
MSLNLKLQAIPEASRLFELVKISPGHGEALAFFARYFDDLYLSPTNQNDDIDDMFYAEFQNIKRAHPGVERRKIDLDKAWDALHFILSESRRTRTMSCCKEGVLPAQDYGTIAVKGEMDVHENAKAPQGIHIRYVSPETVTRIARWLTTFTFEDVKIHYNPVQMSESVYGLWFGPGFEDDDCLWLWERVKQLRDFCQIVSEHREGALVILD